MKNTISNISVIGIGRLGLAWSLVLEKAGYNVLGCDIIEDYVKSLNDKSFTTIEPNVSNYLKNSKNFSATTDLKSAISFSDLIFVNVKTESDNDGKYDHSQLDVFVESIIKLGKQKDSKHIIIATNVNPGYCNDLVERVKPLNYKVSFNPEYVQQGKIIEWDENPEIVVIGSNEQKSGDELEQVLKKVCKNDPPFYRMDLLSAEISKLALNCFLTVKISYANSIGDLALKAGADPSKILEALGGDSRIGPKNLKYGFGYGGPCFPRDNKALLHYADIIGASTPLNKAADDINKKHYNFIFDDFVSKNEKNVTIIFDGIGNMKNLDGDKVKVFEGVAYKPGTSILDESQQLKLAVDLAKNNFHVIINDIYEVTSQLKAEYSDLFHYENKDS